MIVLSSTQLCYSCHRDRPCCEFRGLLLSQSQRCFSFISPCGGLVFAGGNRGQVNVWKSDTGIALSSLQVHNINLRICIITGLLEHIYTELPLTAAICAMAYHPTEYILAISAFGSHQPLVVCTHVSHGAASKVPSGAGSSNEREEGAEIMKQDSMILHLNQRFREVTKTLNRATRTE